VNSLLHSTLKFVEKIIMTEIVSIHYCISASNKEPT